MNKALFLLISGFFIFSIHPLSAQLKKLEKNVDKKISKSKRNVQKIGRLVDKADDINEVNENLPINGRAILSYDPDVDDDFGFVKLGNSQPSSEEEDISLPDAQRQLDSLAFQKRMFSVKRRDMERYRNGFVSKSPIIHNINFDTSRYLKPGAKVFGWHPHWMKDAYRSYNFRMLSALAYFSYEVNPADGNYKTIHDWGDSQELIKMAHKDNCRVLLSVSNIGAENNEIFLGNRAARMNCIRTVRRLIAQQEADGVHLDIEDIPENRSDQFIDFVLAMAAEIRKDNQNAWISLSIPTFDFKQSLDLAQLNADVDLFVMMGYEFYGSNSETAGPIAPVNSGSFWWQANLNAAVDYYLAKGLSTDKILLSIPYYGADWVTETLQIPSKAKKFINYPLYRDIQKYGGINRKNEVNSMASFASFIDANDNYHQIWFEDTTSLAQKYDWVQEKKIGGVAIWALGYDNGYPELWQVLENKFGEAPVVDEQSSLGFWGSIGFNLRSLGRNMMVLMRNPSRIFTNPRYLFRLFGVLTGVSMIGFFALYRYGCRMKRTFNLGIKGLMSLLLITMVLVVIIWAMNNNSNFVRGAAFLLGGFIIGALVFLFLSRRFISEKDLP